MSVEWVVFTAMFIAGWYILWFHYVPRSTHMVDQVPEDSGQPIRESPWTRITVNGFQLPAKIIEYQHGWLIRCRPFLGNGKLWLTKADTKVSPLHPRQGLVPQERTLICGENQVRLFGKVAEFVDEMEPSRIDAKTASTNRPIVLTAIGIGAVCLVSAVYYMFFFGVVAGPTLIEELRSGSVNEEDITKVEILKVRSVSKWDFTEAEYDRLERVPVAREAVGELITILKSSTTDGHKHRNHPVGHYRAILKFHHRDGRHFYLLYWAFFYKGDFYMSLDSLSAGTTNPNGGKHYENVPLAEYLAMHDPWWLTVLGEPEWYRKLRTGEK